MPTWLIVIQYTALQGLQVKVQMCVCYIYQNISQHTSNGKHLLCHKAGRQHVRYLLNRYYENSIVVNGTNLVLVVGGLVKETL